MNINVVLNNVCDIDLPSSRSAWRWGMTTAALAVSARCDEFQSRGVRNLRGVRIPPAAGAIFLRITRTYCTAPIVAITNG